MRRWPATAPLSPERKAATRELREHWRASIRAAEAADACARHDAALTELQAAGGVAALDQAGYRKAKRVMLATLRFASHA